MHCVTFQFHCLLFLNPDKNNQYLIMSHSTLFKALSFAKLGDIFKDKKHIFEEPTVEPQTLRNSKSTPNLKREEPRSIKRSTSRFVKNCALKGSNKIWTFLFALFFSGAESTIRFVKDLTREAHLCPPGIQVCPSSPYPDLRFHHVHTLICI